MRELFLELMHLTEGEKKALLISAAPDMYEALCDMVSDRDCLSKATVEFAEKALKKARGESV